MAAKGSKSLSCHWRKISRDVVIASGGDATGTVKDCINNSFFMADMG
ncbi:hypothetical protein SRABI106_03864 [Rahnella aquatilis]|nr:hypothetical protein SRABI106_03864 [Rahnella aquatilis]